MNTNTKTLLLLLMTLISLPSFCHKRYIVNKTPAVALVRMQYVGVNIPTVGFYLAPGETAITEKSDLLKAVYAILLTTNIAPDIARTKNYTTKNNLRDAVNVYATSWIKKEGGAGKGTWDIVGPSCLNCFPEKSLFDYDAFKPAYDAKLQQLGKTGPNKPKDYRELAAISAPLLQEDRFWNLTEARHLAKTHRIEPLHKDSTDSTKTVYYTYAAGQITNPTPGDYDENIKTTHTFMIVKSTKEQRNKAQKPKP